MASNHNPPIDILAEATRRTSPASRYPHQDARLQLVAERERTDSARRELTALFVRLRDILGALRADLDVSTAVVIEETATKTTITTTTIDTTTALTDAVGKEDENQILIASSAVLPIDWADRSHSSLNGLTRHHEAQLHHGHNHQDSHAVLPAGGGGHKETNTAARLHAMPITDSHTTNGANQSKAVDISGLFPLAAILVTLEANALGEPVPEPEVPPLRASTDYILESLARNVAALLTSLAKVVETMGEEVNKELDKKAEEKAQKKAEKAARKQQRADRRMKKEQKKKEERFAKLLEQGIVDGEQQEPGTATVTECRDDEEPNSKKHKHHTSDTTEHNTHSSSSHESEAEHEQEAGGELARQHKLAQQAHKLTVRRLERLERDLAVDERLFEAHLNKLYNELMFGWRVTYANGMSLHAPLDWRLVDEQDGLVEFTPVEM